MLQKELRFYFYFLVNVLFAFIISFYLVFHSPDYSDYYRYYNEVVKNKDLFEQRFEPLYYLLTCFYSNVLGIDFNSFVFICSIFTLLAKLFLAFKINQNSIWLYVFLYPMLGIIVFETIGLRVSLGLVFLLFSVYFNYNERNVSSFFFLAISVAFHYSLILGGLLFVVKFFLHRFKFKHLVICFFLIYLLFGFYMNDILSLLSLQNINPLIADYLSDDINKVDEFSVYFIALYILYIYGCYSFLIMNDLGRIYFSLSVLFFLGALSFSISSVICFRYIDVAIVLYLFSIISITDKSIKGKIALFVIVLFSLYKVASILYFSPVLI